MRGRVRVTGLSAVRTELRVLADRVPDTARKQMRRSADRIVALAKEYAPEDTSNLVNGIQVIKDYAGMNGRLQIDVGVVMPADAFSASGTPLTAAQFDEYVALVHENYWDAVAYVNGPGKKTLRKIAQHGQKVGNGFLRTAAQDEQPRMEKSLIQEVTKVIDQETKA